MTCFDASRLRTGAHTSPIYIDDYCLATFDPSLFIHSEDEVDEQGRVIGSATGVGIGGGFFVVHKRLYAGFGVEFQAWQPGPVDLSAFDEAGLQRSVVSAPFAGPQGLRCFAAVYLPRGIGIVGFGGIPEGHILRVCPLGTDLGPNPKHPGGPGGLLDLPRSWPVRRASA